MKFIPQSKRTPEKVLQWAERNREMVVREANRIAKAYGTTWATDITVSRDAPSGVLEYDEPHGESKTGIRAKLCAVKQWPRTYDYVAMTCHVRVNASSLAFREFGEQIWL